MTTPHSTSTERTHHCQSSSGLAPRRVREGHGPSCRRGRGYLLPSSRPARLVLAALAASGLVACAKPNTNAPGIEGMGAPGIAWSEKSYQQRMGYMAAFVHPRSEQLFVEYDSSYEGDFTCETCHGEDAELNDYEMPSPGLYELPRENAIEEAREYDAEVTAFMADELTPKFNEWFNRGDGPKTQVTCFSCHPVEE